MTYEAYGDIVIFESHSLDIYRIPLCIFHLLLVLLSLTAYNFNFDLKST